MAAAARVINELYWPEYCVARWLEAARAGLTARRVALVVVFGLFLTGQALYAAHVGEGSKGVAKHVAAACEICLAGASSGDPEALAPVVLAPAAPVETPASITLTRLLSVFAVRAAAPRGPPLC